MFLALKEMKKEKGRFILVIGIVALISYLVFFLTGLAYGLAKDNTTAVEQWNATRIVLGKGTNSNILSSMIDIKELDNFKGDNVSPINIGRSVAYKNGDESDENTINLVLMGLKQDSKAYPEVLEGKKPSNKDEVLASSTLKKEYGVKIGDKLVLSMNEREFKVTGFTKEAKFSVASVIYTDLQEASSSKMSFKPQEDNNSKDKKSMGKPQEDNNSKDKKSMGKPQEKPKDMKGAKMDNKMDATSAPTKTAPERIAGIIVHDDKKIENEDNYDVIPVGDFIKELPGYTAQVLTFGFMIGFLILISTIVLGVFMFIITLQKKQVFGIMKVQGISNRYISNSVIFQTLIVSLIGILIGFLFTVISDIFLPSGVPFKSNYLFYLVIVVVMLVISLLGAIFSVRAVTKVDPLEVLD